jgi:hypothetical protein
MNLLSSKEILFLKFVFAAALLLTFASIFLKFIDGYKYALEEQQIGFAMYSFYKIYNHFAFFTLFSILIFLSSLALKKHMETCYFSVISFCLLSISLLQAAFLPVWFAAIVNINFNFDLIHFNFFDGLLYICFAIIAIFYLKIICRFTREKFRAKISLR